MVGKDKIPVLLINKSQELIDQLIPTIIQIASQVGIENIGQPNEKLPNTCLPKDELEKTDIPYIISKGRKGGSNLAAAIINAILYAM